MPRAASRTSTALGTKKKAADDAKGNHSKRQKNARHSWADGLYKYLDDASDPAVVYADDEIIAVKDMYPKAKCHYLVMPRDRAYKSIKDLTEDDIVLLERMEAVGNRLVCDNNENGDPSLEYRMGFHAVQSMNHLHMHVISQDFDSECLKNKKHWNSFTTTFFVPIEEVFGALNAGASMDFSYRENRLKDALKCHRCAKAQANLPRLKEHIASCSCNPRRTEGSY